MPAIFPAFRHGLCLLVVGALAGTLAAADIDQPPFHYSQSSPDNAVERLQEKLDGGTARLDFTDDHGYLASVLEALDIPLSSQVLVFSKTSFQRQRIGPRTPRAIYFNDDTYVGFCFHGEVMEVSAADPKLGAVFYTLDQQPAPKPRFVRQTDNCLLCHGSTPTHGYPGHLVRSVFPDEEGNPICSLGTLRVDQATPLADRWGGWYVTGTNGRNAHRGNVILSGATKKPRGGQPDPNNVADLRPWFAVENYLSPHSDVVALMVLEHQAEMHNLLTRARYEVQLAVYQQADIDRALGRASEGLSESTRRRVQSACEPLVRYMLFRDEAKLADKVSGSSTFAADFSARGPRDKQGRSLRDLDLERRLFKYPCSYLIYSRAFDGLPKEARDYVYRRLGEVLADGDAPPEFAHLSPADRKAIREILLETKPDLADAWKQP